MQLFYSPDIAPMFTLDAEESRHAVRVMRLREGDMIHVTDGHGVMAQCRIVTAEEKGCVVEAVNVGMADVLPVNLCLAVAPTKNPSRMEWLVEKAVEVGVTQIYLLQGDHSERVFMKTDRLQRIAVSAMKQSLRGILPDILPVMSVREFISEVSFPDDSQLFIAHCEADKPRTPLVSALQANRNTTVLIGPEGDFSEEEIVLALEHGYQPVSLGPSRLRTETAALYAVTAFNLINDRS